MRYNVYGQRGVEAQMQRQKIVKWLSLIVLILLIGYFISQYGLLPFEWMLSDIFSVEYGFTDATPEEVFGKYVQDYQSKLNLNDEITLLEGLEGAIAFGVQGPAFVKFEATDEFTNELLHRESSSGLYGHPAKYTPYVSMSCTFFQKSSLHALMKQFPDRFEWWVASTVPSPTCYQSLGEHYNDGGKYLLVDSKNNTVYFYNSEICQICQD